MISLCAFADEGGYTLSEQIDILKKNNVYKIELRSISGKNVSSFSDEDAISYYNQLSSNGIEVYSIGSPLGKVDLCDADAHLKTVKRVCEIANIFKAKRVRMFSFYKAFDDFDKVAYYLDKMCQIAKEHDVIFCHENEKDIYGDTADRVKQIYDKNIDGLRFVFDPANYIQCGEYIPDAFSKTFAFTDYFHVKDVESSSGAIVPAGYGDGAFDTIIQAVKNSGKDYVFTLEPHLKVFSGYSDIDNTEMKNKFVYKSNTESFCAAVDAFKAVLLKNGYKEVDLNDGTKGWV
jgi:sugar phosphate isomerase/epimerase